MCAWLEFIFGEVVSGCSGVWVQACLGCRVAVVMWGGGGGRCGEGGMEGGMGREGGGREV